MYPHHGGSSSAAKRSSSSFYPPPRIACFVCGSQCPADYPLYASADTNSPNVPPHFPFLLQHPPPLGMPPLETNEARSCRICYTTLMAQWGDHERRRIPPYKRVYYVKRVDGQAFPSPEAQLRANHALRMHQDAAASGAGAMPAPPTVLPSALPDLLPEGRAKVATSPLANHSWPPSSSSSAASASRRQSSRAAAAPPSSEDASSSVAPPPTSTAGGSSALPSTKNDDNDSALDLSSGSRDRETMKSRSSVASHVSAVSNPSSYQSEGVWSSANSLDLTLPDRNAAYEVCYVCGDEFKRNLLSFTFARQMNREPFYPDLLNHPRPSRSRPMDATGRVLTCDDCHHDLEEQWGVFERDDVLHAERKYRLRKRPAPTNVDNTTFVCYMCALEYPSSSLQLVYVSPNAENEPYYPFIEQQRPPPGAIHISPQGMVQVCTLCFKSAKETKEKMASGASTPTPPNSLVRKAPMPAVPPKKKLRYDPDAYNDDECGMPADVVCLLCRRKFSVHSFKFLHTKPPPAGGLPFFPFLTTMPLPEEALDPEAADEKRVRACQSCTTSLMNQWTQFQREHVTVDERSYTYPSQVTGARSVTSSVRAHSPCSQRSSGARTPIKTTGQPQPPPNLDIPPSAVRPRSNTQESRPSHTHSLSNPHSPNPSAPPPPTSSASAARTPATSATAAPTCHSPSFSSVHSGHSNYTGGGPSAAVSTTASAATTAESNSGCATKTGAGASGEKGSSSSSSASSFYCFLCGLHSELSFSRLLYATAPAKNAPHFPFMRTHRPKHKAETLRDDGTALVCTFCYHQAMYQWNKYNDKKSKVDPSKRTYNIHDYNCYVCGITTYRKRIRALRVRVRTQLSFKIKMSLFLCRGRVSFNTSSLILRREGHKVFFLLNIRTFFLLFMLTSSLCSFF